MKKALRVLIIEDSEDDTLLVLLQLKRGGYDIDYERVDTFEKMKVALGKKWDVVLSDYTMPHFSGIEALKLLKETGIDIPFLIISGAIGEETAVEVMKAGAHDYIMKNNMYRLVPAIEREIRESENRAERKLLEIKQIQAEAIKESTERIIKLSKAVEQSPVSIIITDKKGIIEYANPFCTYNTGYKNEELIGQNPRIFSSGLTPDNVYETLWNTISNGNIWKGEICNRKKNSDLYWEWVSISPITNSKGDITHYVGIKEDITERIQANAEIKLKNKELQKLNAEKDQFFAIIAHDLRSPFVSFLGLTELMAEHLSSLSAEKIREFATHIRDAAVNIYSLLENLLDWARMQRGLIPFKPGMLLLRPAIEESLATVRESAQNKGIEITVDIPDQLKVLADTNMFQTVIRNLVSNAVKFTPKGGKISISAKKNKNKEVEISIKDTGIGMSKEILDNLFRLDVDTNRTGTDDEPSSGLGLLLCKEFIEKHNGKIWVESREGNGTTFILTFPHK